MSSPIKFTNSSPSLIGLTISTWRARADNVEANDLVRDNTGPLNELENLDKG